MAVAVNYFAVVSAQNRWQRNNNIFVLFKKGGGDGSHGSASTAPSII